jgi:hypothetical protein
MTMKPKDQSPTGIPVYLEIGDRRTFAAALDWPGWCRSGRDEPSALQALVTYAPRYAPVVASATLEFELPATLADLAVVHRLPGSATTDFGSPAAVPAADESPLDRSELARLAALLRACWLAFDAAVRSAEGRALRKGPRGGGRDLPAIIHHVVEANRAYLRKLAWKPTVDPKADPAAQMDPMLGQVLRALAASAAGELPSSGPRGGKLWVPRYFARRAAWHVLDHAWEIEDRIL